MTSHHHWLKKAAVVWLFLGALLVQFAELSHAEISQPRNADGITEVTIGVYVLDIDGIDTANQSFTANIALIMSWHDPRLAQTEADRVSVPLNNVWNPRVQIVNQQKIWPTFPEIVEIDNQGNALYRQRYWGDFSQPLDLKDFPFDSQNFKFHFVAAGNSPDDLVFIKHPMTGISDRLSVADWDVKNITAGSEPFGFSTNPKMIAGYSVEIEASRKSGYFWVKVIIPLILIVMMSWIVFWIDPRESGSQISVAITSMLTLIAYRFAVGADMPKLSYLTRLDLFILGGTVLVFASLLVVVVTSTYAKTGKVDRAQTIDLWARVLFPLGFILLGLKALVPGFDF
jgi:hypothetical protein